MQPTRAVCIREIQKDLRDSVRQLLVDKIETLGVQRHFRILDNEIRSRDGHSLTIFKGMRDYTSDSIKSLEGFDVGWFTEAQRASQRSLDLLRPTIRKEDSELWFDWNPENEEDPIEFLRRRPPPGAVVVEANWRDNPWFPEVLRAEMLADTQADPEKAEHIWGGGYKQAPKGAYYAKLLAEAKLQGRVGNVPHDPILEVHVSFDLGNGPNMALWFSQWVGREVRVIDYLQGDDDATQEGWPWYFRQMREGIRSKYRYGDMILPHDARVKQRAANGKGDEDTLREAGYRTRVVSPMNPGERVKLVQGFLPKCWIDETRCSLGLKAMKHYEADVDEKNHVDRGPKHNWASHPADGFGHMVQAYEEPRAKPKASVTNRGSWMS